MIAFAAQIDTHSPFGTYPAGGVDRLAWRLIDGGGVRARLRRQAGGLIRRMFPGPYDAEVDGLKFRLYPGENYDDRKIMARARLPEQEERTLMEPLLRPDTVFVDIGANVGTYALYAARRGARVLAIEAATATAEKLAFNIAANAADSRACGDDGGNASSGADEATIRIARTAVGEEAGQLTLWSSATNVGFATLDGEFADGQAGIWTASQVAVRPLAEVLGEAGITRADVMKIDVEGYEDRVLMPYLTATERAMWPRAVMMETNCANAWGTDPRDMLTANGYEKAGETDDNVLLVDTGATNAQ